MNDKLEYEREEACAKDMSTNAEINNEKIFVGLYQGQGKNENNVLVIINIGMTSHCREWIHDIYGGKYKLRGDRTHDFSVMLNKKDKSKSLWEIEECLSE